MEKDLRAYLVELVGTFTFVFLSAALICAVHIPLTTGQPTIGLVGVAVGLGCLLAVLLTVTTKVSEGCLNPAITLMLWVTGRFDGRRAVALCLVQLLGAALAGGLIVLLFGDSVLIASHVGTPHLQESIRGTAENVSIGRLLAGVAVEAGLTFLFGLALFVSLFDPKRMHIGGLLAGVAFTACILIGYHLTGAAINPARWLGTALWQSSFPELKAQGVYVDHLVYWMGPILGGLFAGIFYTTLIRPPETKQDG